MAKGQRAITVPVPVTRGEDGRIVPGACSERQPATATEETWSCRHDDLCTTPPAVVNSDPIAGFTRRDRPPAGALLFPKGFPNDIEFRAID